MKCPWLAKQFCTFHPSLHQSFTKYSHIPSTIYNADNQFIGSNQKLWFHSEKIKQFQQPFFRLTTRIFVHKGNSYIWYFIVTSTDFSILHNKDTCKAFFLKSVCIRGYSGPHFLAFGLNTERYSSDTQHNKSNLKQLYLSHAF